jgi:hypothetical protein
MDTNEREQKNNLTGETSGALHGSPDEQESIPTIMHLLNFASIRVHSCPFAVPVLCLLRLFAAINGSALNLGVFAALRKILFVFSSRPFAVYFFFVFPLRLCGFA